ncbi:MAG: 50S ribosomal protein L20 [Armatimonadota bacterium]
MEGVRKAGLELNRKMLADLAATDPPAFAKVVERARAALGAQ